MQGLFNLEDERTRTSSFATHGSADPDCVPILRFLGMNLERVDEERGKQELDMPVG